MGQCSHFVTQVPVREKLNVQQTITKAIYLKGNNQILIEFADNTASNV